MLHNNISVINATPVVTQRPFPRWLVRKNLCQLLAVMYLTSAPQQQLDDFCNGALTELLFHILSRNFQSVVHFYWIGHPHYDGTPSSVQLLQYQFFAKSKGR